MTGTTNLNITEVAVNQNQPEVTVNTALDALDNASNRTLAISFTANARTLTATEFTRNNRFAGGNGTVDAVLTVPLTSRSFVIQNTGSTNAISVKGTTGATVTVQSLANISLFGDGTNIIAESGATVGAPMSGTGITVSGSVVNLANIASLDLLANTTTASAAPIPTSASTFLDAVFGTNEGAILTRNGSLWVEITPGTSGFALVSQGTSAVPAWAAQSGGAGAWSAGTVTAVGHGLEIDSGTIQAQGTLAYNGTNAGTVTITPTAGVSDVIVNAPSAGGTITLAVAPAYAYQEWRTHIKQGATASVVNLNSGYVFAPTGGPTGFTATATANVRDVFWNQSVDGTHAVVGALLQGITI